MSVVKAKIVFGTLALAFAALSVAPQAASACPGEDKKKPSFCPGEDKKPSACPGEDKKKPSFCPGEDKKKAP